ncbi:MAG: radical SAM protein [Selenomonadales bacterium]|nr:radical SAM protein [Selenomonadales bacterium]
MFKLIYADKHGQVFEDENYGAVMRTGGMLVEPEQEDMIPLPPGASFVVLPGREAAAIDRRGRIVPYARMGAQAVAALLPQGYLRTLLPGYRKTQETLPLFGYTGVAWSRGRFYVAAVPAAASNDLTRWDPSLFNTPELAELIAKRRKEFGSNRVLAQLIHCAESYGCFTAQNMLYRRFEAGLPISPRCNANCVGCISLQASECCPAPQARIDFVPTADEAAALAVGHLTGGGDTVSFGQGCEGEPLLESTLAAKIVCAVRGQTKLGRINMNTNAGNFAGLREVVDAGIDSLRVSLNSPRPEYYDPYYRQQSYDLDDVVQGIKYARSRGVYVSLNLLVMPGVSDRSEEVAALQRFVRETGVNQVQFRNLNIDPDLYLGLLPEAKGELLGMRSLLQAVRETGVSVR